MVANRGFEQDEPRAQVLYNIDNFSAWRAENNDKDPDWIMFVDRVEDVSAVLDAQLDWVVSFDGYLSASKLDAIGDNAETLKKIKKIYLAGSMDRYGLERREAIAKRVGRHRVWLIRWPDGCLNAAETLRERGPGGIVEAWETAEPYPIEGLYKPTAATLSALRDREPPGTMTTGVASTNEILKLPTEGRLIVVTGYPAGGKTSWTRFVMVHTAREHGRRWAVFSPEMMPWEQFAADCAEVYSGLSFWPSGNFPAMDRRQIGEAGAWLESRLTMIVMDSEDRAPTLDWVLECAADAVLRDGVTDLLIDPWNEVEHGRDRGVTETDYIGRALQQVKAFGMRYGCNVWIIAHPSKPFGVKTGDIKPPPGPYDISGSSHWANKPDVGITIHSVMDSVATLYLWKARFRRFGSKDTDAAMSYNRYNGQYFNPVGYVAPEADVRIPYSED